MEKEDLAATEGGGGGGRPRATPPCAQRSVSPAEASRPQQPRKSVALAPLSPCSGAAGRFPGLCVAVSVAGNPPAGGLTGPAGNPGRPRPAARSHNAGGGGVPEGGVRPACVCRGVLLFMFSGDLAVESKYDSGRGLYFSPFYLPSLLYCFGEIIWITAAEEVL